MRNLRPARMFDFSVRVSSHVVVTMPGGSLQVPVTVQLDRGQPQPVVLTVATNWASVGISANIIPPTVVPVGGAAMGLLDITVSPNTPPGSYIIAVRGETSGTFKTSEDMVTVVVKPRDQSKGHDEKHDNQAQKPVKASSKSGKSPPPARPSYSGSKAKPGGPSRASIGRRLAGGVFMGIIMSVIIYAAVSSFGSASFGGGGGGSQTWQIYSTSGQQYATATVDGSGNFTASGWVGNAPGIGNYNIYITNGRMSGTSMTFTITASYTGSGQNIYGTAYGTMDAAFPNATSASGTASGTISDPLGDRSFSDTWTATRVD
jgi:hypothetical protein